jgi:peptidoglycan hydrolase CwlO-like protein
LRRELNELRQDLQLSRKELTDIITQRDTKRAHHAERIDSLERQVTEIQTRMVVQKEEAKRYAEEVARKKVALYTFIGGGVLMLVTFLLNMLTKGN